MFIKYEVRSFDSQGAGYFGAPRGRGRTHKGIDFCCQTGERIVCFKAGKVTKIGYPYALNDKRGRGIFRYVQITDDKGIHYRYFYLTPIVSVGDYVRAGAMVGISQDLDRFYQGIKQHFHFEVKDTKGRFLNPNRCLSG